MQIMALNDKFPLPDSLISEMEEYTRLLNIIGRTTTGQVSFVSTSSGNTYNTLGSPYDNLGQSGLAQLLFTTAPSKLQDYIYTDTDYTSMRNSIDQSLNPIVPNSVVSQLINVTTPSNGNKKFTLDIQTTITGGAITISRDGGSALSLKNPDGTDVEELSQDTRFFDIIDDVSVFTLASKGGGGDLWNGLEFVIDSQSGRLYHCDIASKLIYELDINTKLPISSVASPSTFPYGIGGTATKLYLCDVTSDLIYELDLNTKLPISNVSTPGTTPTGIGGTTDRLYHCDTVADRIYELDPITKLSISSVVSPSTQPTGVGGTASRLYLCDSNTDTIYELDLNTKLSISSASAPSTNPYGIGGMSTRLYHCDDASKLIYELDLDTKLSISSIASPSTSPYGIGGIKSAYSTISQVTYQTITYTLTDDCAFKGGGLSG